jgi:hypothetical protein
VLIAEAKQRRRQKTNKDGGEGAFYAFGEKYTNAFFFLRKQTYDGSSLFRSFARISQCGVSMPIVPVQSKTPVMATI